MTILQACRACQAAMCGWRERAGIACACHCIGEPELLRATPPSASHISTTVIIDCAAMLGACANTLVTLLAIS